MCPHCGYPLRRYKVGAGAAFGLDHCGHCGGVWLDAPEWAGLKARGLHGALNRIFTDTWQRRVGVSPVYDRRFPDGSFTARQKRGHNPGTHPRRVRWEEHSWFLTQWYRERLGDSDWAELLIIRTWLDRHEHRSLLLGYLNAPEPPPTTDPGD